MIEAEAKGVQAAVQRFLAGMAEGRMPDVVHQGQGFGEIGVQPQSRGHGARDLRYLQRMGEPAAEVIAGKFAEDPREHLCFSGQAPEGTRMQNARTIAGEGRPVRVRTFLVNSPCELGPGLSDGSDAGGQCLVCLLAHVATLS